jgi:LysM repeat protein
LKEPSGILSSRQSRQITLSLPVALLLLVFFTLVSAGLTFAAMQFIPSSEVQTTPTVTSTQTPTQTSTPEPTSTSTPRPTFTPLPPIEYTIAIGDSCVGLAFFYDISVRSIIELNSLGVDCLLSVGTTILIPQPTPTNTPEPTATLSAAEATDEACEKIPYTVQANDTLSSIAENYSVSMQGIKEYNGMISDTVLEGLTLIIPLCERITFGPTATPTPPPPHPAPNLLLPQDGTAFTLANETVTLQWASVGQLREGEYYEVIVEDITDGTGRRRVVDYVTDTKFIIPESFRPTETTPHIMRWRVSTVRQTGTTAGGDSSYQSAGAASIKRSFTWSGSTSQATPTP